MPDRLSFNGVPKDRAPTSNTPIKRGLDFIYRVASTPEGFDSYGSLLICCFALVGATSRDANIRQLTRSRAQKLAQRWSRQHPVVPDNATSELVLDFVMTRYALGRIGLRDAGLNAQIRSAAQHFSAQDLLGFNPLTEPPPSDSALPVRVWLQKSSRANLLQAMQKAPGKSEPLSRLDGSVGQHLCRGALRRALWG